MAGAPEEPELERLPLLRMLGDDQRDRVPLGVVAHGLPDVPRVDRVPHARVVYELARRARLDRPQAEVGVLAAVEALVEPAEPLEQRARVRDVAGLVPGGRLPDRLRGREPVEPDELVGVGLGAALKDSGPVPCSRRRAGARASPARAGSRRR